MTVSPPPVQPRLLWIEEAPSRREVWTSRARETLLTAGAVAGVLCLLLAAIALLFDVRPVVFRSGSMSPAIETGALAISREVPATELRAGDVVTVQSSTGVNVTHRIESMRLDGDVATLVLKGDANGAVDDQTYAVESAPRVLADVPRLGYVVAWISGTPGTFAGGLLVGIVLLVAFRPSRPGRGRRRMIDDGSEHGRGGAHRALVGAGVVALALSVVTLPGATTSTQAYYGDTATLAGGTFTRAAAAPAAPSIGSCTRSGESITLTWGAVPGATSYVVSWTRPNSGGTATVTTTTWSSSNVNFNNTDGQIRVRAVNASGSSADSPAWAYRGNGANATCNPA